MSAHSHPSISLWRMAVYAAALVVLATARLPDPPSEEILVAPTAVRLHRVPDSVGIQSPDPSIGPSVYPSVRPSAFPSSSAIRLLLATILVAGLTIDARRRRLSWR